MRYKKLGGTGLEVSVIGYGAIKLPRISQDVATACINRALDLGVNFIDTARAYGDSERKIGIATEGRRDEFYIATKTGERTADGAKADLKTSLSELKMDRIDLWQLHSVSDREQYEKVMGPGGALEAAKWAKKQGLVDHIGITIHRDLDVMRDAIESGEFETIMLAHSVLDQESVEAQGILKFAKEHDETLTIKAAVMGGKVLDLSAIKKLSALPSRDMLLGQLLALLNGVPTAFVRIMNEIPRSFLNVLQAIKEQKEKAPNN